jgi:hypothetical protein
MDAAWPRFVLDEQCELRSGLDQPDLPSLEAESGPFGVVLAPNGHTTPPIIICIAAHGVP